MNVLCKQYQILRVLFFSVLLFAPLYTQHARAEYVARLEYQTHSGNFRENRSHGDFSYNNTWDNPGKSPAHQPHFNQYTAQAFKNHFTARGYSESQVLNQRCLYMFDEFVKFAQTYSNYTCTIQQIHVALKNLNFLQKA